MDGLPFPAQILTLAAGADLSAVLLRRSDSSSSETADKGTGGEVYVWGSGAEGELGLGQLRLESSIPTRLSLDEPVAQLSIGYHHTAILTGMRFSDYDSRQLYKFNDSFIFWHLIAINMNS